MTEEKHQIFDILDAQLDSLEAVEAIFGDGSLSTTEFLEVEGCHEIILPLNKSIEIREQFSACLYDTVIIGPPFPRNAIYNFIQKHKTNKKISHKIFCDFIAHEITKNHVDNVRPLMLTIIVLFSSCTLATTCYGIYVKIAMGASSSSLNENKYVKPQIYLVAVPDIIQRGDSLLLPLLYNEDQINVSSTQLSIFLLGSGKMTMTLSMNDVTHTIEELYKILGANPWSNLAEVFQRGKELLQMLIMNIQKEDEAFQCHFTELQKTHEEEKNKISFLINKNPIPAPVAMPHILGRRLFYSHHIRSPIKRSLIIEWSRELELGGYSKIGWPGVIIVEGPEIFCMEYLRRLQHLRWKHFVCRGEQQITCDIEKQLDYYRVLPKSVRELGDLGLLASLCKEAGLYNLFLTAMKIYRDDDEGDTTNA